MSSSASFLSSLSLRGRPKYSNHQYDNDEKIPRRFSLSSRASSATLHTCSSRSAQPVVCLDGQEVPHYPIDHVITRNLLAESSGKQSQFHASLPKSFTFSQPPAVYIVADRSDLGADLLRIPHRSSSIGDLNKPFRPHPGEITKTESSGQGVNRNSIAQSFLPTAASMPAGLNDETSISENDPDSIFGPTRRCQNRTSSTWSSSEGFSEQNKEDREPFVQDYNKLAQRCGLPVIAPDGFETLKMDRVTIEGPHGSWLMRKILKRTTSHQQLRVKSQSPQSANTYGLRLKRSFIDLSSHKRVAKQRDILKGQDIDDLVLLCGSSVLWLPREYAAATLNIPTCFRATAQYLVQYAKSSRGIFRTSGSKAIVDALYNHYAFQDDQIEHISGTVRCPQLPEHIRFDVHDVATVFKRLLAGLPQGILGSTWLFDALLEIHKGFNTAPETPRTKQTKTRARLIAYAIASVPSKHLRELICGVFGLLCIVGRTAETTRREDNHGNPLPTADLMGYHSLGVIFGPLLTGNGHDGCGISSDSNCTAHKQFSDQPVSSARSSWRTKRKYRSADCEPVLSTRCEEIHPAINVAEMLIIHWRDVVRQMRNFGALRPMREYRTRIKIQRSRRSSHSIGDFFGIQRPSDWNQHIMPIAKTREQSMDNSPTPRPRSNSNLLKEQDVYVNGIGDGLSVRKLRSKVRPMSSQMMSSKAMSILTPTAEEAGMDANIDNIYTIIPSSSTTICFQEPLCASSSSISKNDLVSGPYKGTSRGSIFKTRAEPQALQEMSPPSAHPADAPAIFNNPLGAEPQQSIQLGKADMPVGKFDTSKQGKSYPHKLRSIHSGKVASTIHCSPIGPKTVSKSHKEASISKQPLPTLNNYPGSQGIVTQQHEIRAEPTLSDLRRGTEQISSDSSPTRKPNTSLLLHRSKQNNVSLARSFRSLKSTQRSSPPTANHDQKFSSPFQEFSHESDVPAGLVPSRLRGMSTTDPGVQSTSLYVRGGYNIPRPKTKSGSASTTSASVFISSSRDPIADINQEADEGSLLQLAAALQNEHPSSNGSALHISQINTTESTDESQSTDLKMPEAVSKASTIVSFPYSTEADAKVVGISPRAYSNQEVLLHKSEHSTSETPNARSRASIAASPPQVASMRRLRSMVPLPSTEMESHVRSKTTSVKTGPKTPHEISVKELIPGSGNVRNSVRTLAARFDNNRTTIAANPISSSERAPASKRPVASPYTINEQSPTPDRRKDSSTASSLITRLIDPDSPTPRSKLRHKQITTPTKASTSSITYAGNQTFHSTQSRSLLGNYRTQSPAEYARTLTPRLPIELPGETSPSHWPQLRHIGSNGSMGTLFSSQPQSRLNTSPAESDQLHSSLNRFPTGGDGSSVLDFSNNVKHGRAINNPAGLPKADGESGLLSQKAFLESNAEALVDEIVLPIRQEETCETPNRIPQIFESGYSRKVSDLQGEILILKKQLSSKNEECESLKQNLDIKSIANEAKELKTLSEELKFLKKELAGWKERAQSAETRCEILQCNMASVDKGFATRAGRRVHHHICSCFNDGRDCGHYGNLAAKTIPASQSPNSIIHTLPTETEGNGPGGISVMFRVEDDKSLHEQPRSKSKNKVTVGALRDQGNSSEPFCDDECGSKGHCSESWSGDEDKENIPPLPDNEIQGRTNDTTELLLSFEST